MKTTQLQRQGVSNTVRGWLPSGAYVEIYFHHGKGTYECKTSLEVKGNNQGTYAWTGHQELSADSLPGAIEETSAILCSPFDPEIEAYCYSGAASLKIWPYIGTDVYITCATYEPGSDTIRHEPTNQCLVTFVKSTAKIKAAVRPRAAWGWGNPWKASLYQHEGNNKEPKRAACIKKAIDVYNSHVKAHGLEDERKEWLAWLISAYLKKTPGQKPKRLQSIRRNGNA